MAIFKSDVQVRYKYCSQDVGECAISHLLTPVFQSPTGCQMAWSNYFAVILRWEFWILVVHLGEQIWGQRSQGQKCNNRFSCIS